MKRYLVPILSLILLPAMAGVGFSQGNPRGLTSVSLSGHSVSVDYGRPSLKGKTINDEIGRLQSGGFWRLGADSSTTFKSSTALKFGDTTIPAGTYSLWAQKESDNSWKLVFNKQHGQWGTDHDPSKDFAFIPLHEQKASSSAEELVIRLRRTGANSGVFLVHWGVMVLSTPFTAA
jgi:Protein of unknown function (DUF2911)